MRKWNDLDNETQESSMYLAERMVEVTGGIAFGLWMHSIFAGVFMFAFLYVLVVLIKGKGEC